jgi:hypothetical protein
VTERHGLGPREAGDAAHDSSGTPWAGRHLHAGGFEDDDGAADPQVLSALRAEGPRTPDDEQALVALVARSRWLVPIVTDPDADLAAVTITGPDGQRALPVFSGVAQLAEWDPAARPVPVPADRAAQAAIREGCDVILVDVGSGHATVLRPSMVWAIAMRRAWVPAYRDPFVAQALARAAGREPDLLGHTLEPGAAGTGALVVTLRLRPGLGPEAVRALAARVGERLATDGELRARVDDLVFRITGA